MNCHPQTCGLTYEEALAYFENYIANAILCGRLQGGLSVCGSDTNIPQGTQIVSCTQLEGLINDLLGEGKLNIPGIESLTFEYPNVFLVDQAGTTHTMDLTALAAKGVRQLALHDGGVLHLQLLDDTVLNVELEPFVQQVAERTKVLEGHADEKLNIILTLANGDQIIVNLGDQFTEMNELQQKVLKEILQLNQDAVLLALQTEAGKTRVTDMALDVDRAIVLTRGDGTQLRMDTTPLRKIDLGRDSPFEWNDKGELVFNPERIQWDVIKEITFDKDGLHLQLDNQCNELVIKIEDFVLALSGLIKIKVCEQGILTGDGTEENPLCVDLVRLIELLTDNSAEMDALLKKLIIELNRVSGPCEVDIQTVETDHTLVNTDNVILLGGGKLIINSASAKAGRQFTIVQTTTNKIDVTPVGVTITPPYLGTLTTAGVNAVVTLMCVSPTEYRLFGQTEEA